MNPVLVSQKTVTKLLLFFCRGVRPFHATWTDGDWNPDSLSQGWVQDCLSVPAPVASDAACVWHERFSVQSSLNFFPVLSVMDFLLSEQVSQQATVIYCPNSAVTCQRLWSKRLILQLIRVFLYFPLCSSFFFFPSSNIVLWAQHLLSPWQRSYASGDSFLTSKPEGCCFDA